MAILDHLFAVIPMLGILIFVHELGHFLMAKACGVRVLKFSIGFGAPIGFGDYRLRWERSGTEYVVGWIPLGGFVRMLGEYLPGEEGNAASLPDDVRPDEFLEAKPVWQKLSIMFAGPLMNLLLPVLCMLGILWFGLPRLDAVVGMVEANSPAADAGIRAGDRIVSLDGETVEWWDEVALTISESSSGETLLVGIDRDGNRENLEVSIVSQRALDRFGLVAEAGWVGLGHRRLSALVGVPEDTSPASLAGLQSGDLVLTIDDVAVGDWEELRRHYRAAASAARTRGLGTVHFKVERNSPAIFGEPPRPTGASSAAESETKLGDPNEETRPKVEIIELELAAAATLQALGVTPASILIHQVEPGMPADQAGLEANDLILSVDGEPIGSFESFASLIQTSGGRELEIAYSRHGRVEVTQIQPREIEVPGLYGIEGMEQKVYRVGISNALSSLPGSTSVDRVRNPIVSVPKSVEMSWRMTTDYLEGLGKMFSGDIGTGKLSGPIGIARIARESLDRGWLEYVFMMMVISINLGILNLLPIPILDGGQILIYSIEGIKRSPVSFRTREIASQLGFAVLIVLMGRAFWNDLTPFWMQFVRWISTSP